MHFPLVCAGTSNFKPQVCALGYKDMPWTTSPGEKSLGRPATEARGGTLQKIPGTRYRPNKSLAGYALYDQSGVSWLGERETISPGLPITRSDAFVN